MRQALEDFEVLTVIYCLVLTLLATTEGPFLHSHTYKEGYKMAENEQFTDEDVQQLLRDLNEDDRGLCKIFYPEEANMAENGYVCSNCGAQQPGEPALEMAGKKFCSSCADDIKEDMEEFEQRKQERENSCPGCGAPGTGGGLCNVCKGDLNRD